MRSVLRSVMEASNRFEICAETDNAPTARDLFTRHQPKLVVLGLTLRGGDGVQLVKDLRKLNEAAATLVLSARDDELSIQRAFRAGAHGYLRVQDATAAETLRALDEILAGHLYASAGALPRLLKNIAIGKVDVLAVTVKSLSDRELEIFYLIGRGLGVSQLARELHVSVKTVETHQLRMKEKLDLHSAAELRQKAVAWLSKSARESLYFHSERIAR